MREDLKRVNAETLPTSEAQVRPLSRLNGQMPNSPSGVEIQIKCWQRACLVKKKKHPPTAVDVTREVNKVLIPKPDETTDQALRAYRSDINRCKQWITRANKLLEDGSLDSFFLLCQSGGAAGRRAKNKRKFVAYQLSEISKILGDQVDAFGSGKGEAIAPAADLALYPFEARLPGFSGSETTDL